MIFPLFRFAFIYHLSKECPRRRADTEPSMSHVVAEAMNQKKKKEDRDRDNHVHVPTAPLLDTVDHEPDLTRQASEQKQINKYQTPPAANNHSYAQTTKAIK